MITAPVQITVITDNRSNSTQMQTEHGLSLWVEVPGYCFLLDTGVGKTFRHNLNALGMDLSRLNGLIFSHGHYDHTNGLEALGDAVDLSLYLGEGFMAPRYAKATGEPGRYIGLSEKSLSILSARRNQLRTIGPYLEVYPGIHLFGHVPMKNSFERLSARFYLDQEGRIPDGFLDEVAVAIESPQGLIILSGCSHRGIINTVERIVSTLKTDKIAALIGGMHLVNAEKPRIEKTLDALEKWDIHTLMPLHCTGDEAIEAIAARYPERFVRGGAGSRFCLD